MGSGVTAGGFGGATRGLRCSEGLRVATDHVAWFGAGPLRPEIAPLSVSDLITLTALIDDSKCFSMIREYRWPDGVHCPRCSTASVVCNGHDDRQKDRQRYLCKDCSFRFDDLTHTILAGRHQPLKMWVLCLYFMGLNLSNRQIAKELGLNESDVQAMTCELREGITASAPAVQLEGKVEADEAYVVAGHKGNPAAVQKKAASDGAGGSREHLRLPSNDATHHWIFGRLRLDAARWRKKSHRSSV